MAKVSIKGAEVFKLIPNYGFKATETFKLNNGEDAKRYYTVWTDEKFNEGDIVDIVGDLSVKVEEYTGKDNKPRTSAAVHINNPKITSEAPF